VRRKRPELWRNDNWLLHHDNEAARTSLKTTEFVTNNNIAIVLHPPYSPDLAPYDFALFPKFKMKLKGRRFETVSNIQRESQALRKITSTVILKRGRNNGIAVYVPKETSLKEMAANIE
jgi:transposase